MSALEINSRHGWRRLEEDGPAPAIDESDLFAIRGLQPDARVEIGDQRTRADGSGRASILLREHESLRGHLGLVTVMVDGRAAGEVEIRPDKLSSPAYAVLRSDLDAVWSRLVLDPDGVSRLEASLPPATTLWRRIERPVRDLLERPREAIVPGTAVRALRAVRKPLELTPAFVRRVRTGRPGRTRALVRSTRTPEQALVVATLRGLATHARRRGEEDIEHRLFRLMRHPTLDACGSLPPRITWGMRSDPRYRQVLDVYRLLDRPELGATEGPGELRLGVLGISRLYEYWVFLQVLILCQRRYGSPAAPGYEVLARRLGGGRLRLEIDPGTTVTFPGPVHVAFEPRLTPRADGWMGLEYVPHPDPSLAKTHATPDVVVYRPGSVPWITVVDAKYVGRAWVERQAAEIHQKYARVRVSDTPAVRHVLAAHPHQGLSCLWCGYGHGTFAPSVQPFEIALPPTGSLPDQDMQVGNASRAMASGSRVVLLADQHWMRRHLGDRRIDLRALGSTAASGAEVHEAHIIMPGLPGLSGFKHAIRTLGWTIHHKDGVDRERDLDLMVGLARRYDAETHLVIVSGDRTLLDRLESVGLRFEVVDDLSRLPDLRQT